MVLKYQFPFPIRFFDHGDGYKSTVDRSQPHRGVDFNGKYAERWLNTSDKAAAIAAGTVVFNGWHSALGNVVVLQHPDGIFSGYCHLSAVENLGPTVLRGAPIGNIGNTGSASGGVHLHLTTAYTQAGALGADPYDANHFDPIPFISARLNGDDPGATPEPTPEEEDDMPKVIHRIDAGVYTFALYDGLHWEETHDNDRANIWAALYGDSKLQNTAAQLTAWNWRSDSGLGAPVKKAFNA